MSADPSHNLQKAVYAALTSAPVLPKVPLATDTRTMVWPVFHRVPENQPVPFVVIGDDQILADYDAADFSECHVIVHVFASSMPELKLIVAKVRAALDQHIEIEGFDTAEAQFMSTRYMTDPDGATEHAVIEFQYLVIERQ